MKNHILSDIDENNLINDADNLLEPALALAKYRVVVKRPSYAPPLANKKPSMSINMKKNRFDVYVNKAIPKL